jgi:glycosyltransferase involved in cell wall biosynthesis
MNDLSLPLVTIGIPTYNRLTLLKEAVASALVQTYSNIEIEICQNPHQDPLITQAIAEWCRYIQRLHPQIQYYLNAENRGAGANFNQLGDHARGEYLLMIGDDDRLLPQAVEQLMSVIPGYTLAFANHHLINAKGQRLDASTAECTEFYGRAAMRPGEVNSEMAAWHRSPSVEATLFRTEAFRTIKMQEDLSAHDTHMFIQLARSSGRFVFTPDYVSEIRTHSNNATAAGLETDKLAQVLILIPVSPDIETLKRDLIGQLLVEATSRYLHQGNFAMARSLVQNPYFPKTSFRAKVQSLFALMPKPIGHPIYRLLWALKNPARKIAESSQHPEDFYNLPHLAIGH